MEENKPILVEERKLPELVDLVNDIESYEKSDQLNFLLNQEVPKQWVAKHPFINKTIEIEGKKMSVPYEYLPIDKVEYLLRKVFKKYKIEILREGQSFNGVFVSVRVHYFDFINGEWMFHDGIGAINLQVKKGSSPSDLANINNGALSMAYPLAKTLAVKDACDHFGKLFGSDLNRKDTLDASLDVSVKEKVKSLEELK